MIKMLVFGNGWLGNKFARRFKAPISSVNILDASQVEKMLRSHKPDVVVNAAGKTGTPNIDWCAATPENKQLTWLSNAVAPVTLRYVMKRSFPKMRLVHLSSGCLWAHGTDLDENEVPEPPSWYSSTKAEAEERLKNDPGVLIVRLRMPMDSEPSPRNLITKLAGYSHVLNVPNSVTVVDDLFNAVEQLLKLNASGIWNVVNSGSVTGVEVMEAYKRLVDPTHEFTPMDNDTMMTTGKAKEVRSNCTLSNAKLLAAGIDMPDIKGRMEDCLKNYARARERLAI